MTPLIYNIIPDPYSLARTLFSGSRKYHLHFISRCLDVLMPATSSLYVQPPLLGQTFAPLLELPHPKSVGYFSKQLIFKAAIISLFGISICLSMFVPQS